MNKEIQGSLSRIHSLLDDIGGNCDIELAGVRHHGKPPTRLIKHAQSADVVTLELTRGVVQAGLAGQNSNLFRKNPFWGKLVESLGEYREKKKVRGIEVNQSPRIAWKRLNLHFGSIALAPTRYCIEVPAHEVESAAEFLQDEELVTLQKNKWLIASGVKMYHNVQNRISESLTKKVCKGFPVPLSESLALVAFNKTVDSTESFEVTFIVQPHHSVLQSVEEISKLLQHYGYLSARDISETIPNALLPYFFSPVELSEAEEIAYFTKQYIRTDRKSNQKHFGVIHIGGAFHTNVIAQVLNASLPENSERIHIVECYYVPDNKHKDPFFTYFLDHIPLSERLKAARIVDNETELDTDLIVSHVRKAIELPQFEDCILSRRKRR